MAKKTLSTKGMPVPVAAELARMGEYVRLARKRRDMTQADLAQLMFVNPSTVVRLEKGDPAVRLSIVLIAFYCLQLDFQVSALISPEKDYIGTSLDIRRHEKRQQVRKTQPDNLDF